MNLLFEPASYAVNDNGCWVWSGARAFFGYGLTRTRSTSGMHLAHRVSWELENGPIPKGMCVCHKCDNPPCVNHDHLFLGTRGDNIRDAASKGRMPRGEPHHSSKLSETQVRSIRSMASSRMTSASIASEFGVSYQAVCQIVSGITWKWLQ